MAVPTPLPDVINWDGTRGMIRWRAAWANTDNFTAVAIIDLSADLAGPPNSIKIRTIQGSINGNFEARLDFDATTNQIIDFFAGQSDQSNPINVDYTDGPNVGVIPSDTTATGFTGDLLLTTTNAASGDELQLIITFEIKN